MGKVIALRIARDRFTALKHHPTIHGTQVVALQNLCGVERGHANCVSSHQNITFSTLC